MTYPAKKSSSWSKNTGTMPTFAGAQVEVVMRNGLRESGKAADFQWGLVKRTPERFDILKWRFA